jgi:hypothetical protein
MAEGLTGSLAQLPLADLLKMLAAAGQTGRLELTSGLDQGELYIARGEIVHAECDMRTGEGAFTRLAGWPNGQFRFEPQVPAPQRTIEKPLDRLLAETHRAATEREAIRRVVPNMDVVPHLSRKAPAPSITLEARDWELVAVINGERTAAEIASVLGADDMELARTLYRMKLGGLIEMASLPAAQPVARALAGAGFFQALTTAVAGALGPLAEIIIDDAVEDLGFTRATFPRDTVAALAERISSEIREPDKRVKFQQTMLQMLRGSQQAA